MQTSKLPPQSGRSLGEGDQGRPALCIENMGLLLASLLPVVMATACRALWLVRSTLWALSLVDFLQVKTARVAETVAEIHSVLAENLEL